MSEPLVGYDVKLERFRDRETGELVSGRMFRSLFHAAAAIGKSAKRSIRNSPTASPAGRPPRTRRGRLRFAIRYAGDKQRKRVVVGPRASVVGRSAEAMEYGGNYKGDHYPPRPYMRPALERNRHRLGGDFNGSVGG
ncbi:MAG: hypothetical protein AAF805_01135 [Planctomycetota bacterium]